MACCRCCCGGEDCAEGQEGKCCCGDTCCLPGEYCCSGVCEPDPCSGCTGNDDCAEGEWCCEGTCGVYYCCCVTDGDASVSVSGEVGGVSASASGTVTGGYGFITGGAYSFDILVLCTDYYDEPCNTATPRVTGTLVQITAYDTGFPVGTYRGWLVKQTGATCTDSLATLEGLSGTAELCGTADTLTVTFT